MKIRAIRVSEFGRFKEPVALEGLSGGLDLLVGPNEAGKSTLVRALRLALFEKHRSNKEDLRKVRPYSGGAPMVEVDFEACGETWRIRKRFLAERSAMLRSLTSRISARGADAEAELERLLNGNSMPGGVSLLWLDQGQSIDANGPDDVGEDALRGAINREVASSAGGNRTREARARVRDMLSELVTAGRGQPRGDYLAKIAAAETAAQNLVNVRQAHTEVEDWLDRLGQLDNAFSKITAPGARAALAEQLAIAEARLKEAHTDIAARDQARVAASEARMAQAAAETAARSVQVAMEELDRLERQGHTEAVELEGIRSTLTAADTTCSSATDALESVRATAATIETWTRLAEARERRQALAARAEQARVAADRVAALTEALSGLPLDAALLRKARDLAAAAREVRLRLEAASATVTIAYEIGAAAQIRLGEHLLSHGERLLATSPIVLEIANVGRISIDPGASGDRDRMSRELSAQEAALEDILAATGARDLAALETSHDEARRLAAERAEAQAELKAFAPEGLARLEEMLAIAAGASSEADETAVSTSATVDELRRDMARLGAEVRAAEMRRREAEATREELRRKEAVLASRSIQRDQRIVEIGARLPEEGSRATRLAELVASADSASRTLDEALRVASAWDARAPDAAGLQRIEADVTRDRLAQQRAEQEAAGLAEERARVEGALEMARREDIASRLVELEAEAIRARAVQADADEEVAALRLLDSELGAEESRLRDSFLAPVLARLPPYVELVFPGAGIELGEQYNARGLLRGSKAEALDRVSSGTREQVAVLVRLAFGRLLADQGMPVPLLLDDALVYSDDRRIAAMHRALEAAAEAHQVIVLTCREQSFAGLHGTRVALSPWALDEM